MFWNMILWNRKTVLHNQEVADEESMHIVGGGPCLVPKKLTNVSFIPHPVDSDSPAVIFQMSPSSFLQ
jgi:hypothetical protein